MKTQFGKQLLKAIAAESRVRMPWLRQEENAATQDQQLGALALGAGLATGGLADLYLAGPGLALTQSLGPAARMLPFVADGMVSGGLQQAGTAYIGGERDPQVLTQEGVFGATAGGGLGLLGGLAKARELTQVQRSLARLNLEGEMQQLNRLLENAAGPTSERNEAMRRLAQVQAQLTELGGPIGPQPPLRGEPLGGLQFQVHPQGNLDPMMLEDWVKVAEAPEFQRDHHKYNRWMRPLHNVFLGQVKASKSPAEIIEALRSGQVEFRRISGQSKAAVYRMRDKTTGEIYYHLQINPDKDPTGAAMRHELLHLGAMLNGQTERPWYLYALDMPHELAVSWSTTPKIAASTLGLGAAGATMIGALGQTGWETHRLNRQIRKQEQNSPPPVLKKSKQKQGAKASQSGIIPPGSERYR